MSKMSATKRVELCEKLRADMKYCLISNTSADWLLPMQKVRLSHLYVISLPEKQREDTMQGLQTQSAMQDFQSSNVLTITT